MTLQFLEPTTSRGDEQQARIAMLEAQLKAQDRLISALKSNVAEKEAVIESLKDLVSAIA